MRKGKRRALGETLPIRGVLIPPNKTMKNKSKYTRKRKHKNQE